MKSLEELKAIRDKMKGQIGIRSEDEDKTRVVVGMATCGIASGARPVLNFLVNEVQARHLDNVVVTPDRMYRPVPVRAHRRGV